MATSNFEGAFVLQATSRKLQAHLMVKSVANIPENTVVLASDHEKGTSV